MKAPRILLALAPFLISGCMVADIGTRNDPVASAPANGFERLALQLVNDERRDRGLPPMRMDRLVSGTASAHARDMQARGYYSHTSPGGKSVQNRHDDAGGAEWRLVAENIARCARSCVGPVDDARVRQLHQGWMDSPGHRENILSPGLDSFGFAIVTGDDGLYAVQNFSGPGQPTGLKSGDSLAPLSADAQIAQALQFINAARASSGAPPLSASPILSDAVRSALPSPGSPGFDVRSTGDVQAALSERERSRWRGLGTIYGACGACGTAPTGADIRFFVAQWLERDGFRALLLNPDVTHLGFGIAANGEGRKVALASVGAGG